MEYIQIDDDLYIEYDPDKKSSSFLSKSAIINDIDITTEQLNSIPESPSDAELLAWAKENYTNQDVRNREILQNRLVELTDILNNLITNTATISKPIRIIQ